MHPPIPPPMTEGT